MKFDFKKFKKVSSDAKTTRMQHPDGHIITIAHSALTPKTMSQLKALPTYADGGTISDDIKSSIQSETDGTGGVPDNGKGRDVLGVPMNGPEIHAIHRGDEVGAAAAKGAMSKGGKVKKYYPDGGVVGADEPAENAPAQNQAQPAYNPEDYIAVPKQALAQHIEKMRAMDPAGEGSTWDPSDLVGPQEALGAAKVVGAGAMKFGAPLLMGALRGGIKNVAENAAEGTAARDALQWVGQKVAKPFAESAAENKAADRVVTDALGTTQKTAAEAWKGKLGIQSAADVQARNAAEMGERQALRDAARASGKIRSQNRLADGGEIPQSNPKLEESKKQPPKPHYADGTPDGGVQALMADEPQSTEGTDDASVPQDQPPTQEAQSPDQLPEQAPIAQQTPPGASATDAPPSAQQQAPPPPSVPKQVEQSPDFMHGYEAKMGGYKAEADAAKIVGDQAAKVQADQAYNEQQTADKYKANFNALEQERQGHMQDIKNNYINPDKYWENHSKLAAGIGIILAGFNPTGKPNAALEFINNNINRSIEAQRANLGSANNLLSATMHQFNNVNDATNMAHVLMNDAAKSQINAFASKAQGPMAKARAQQLMGQLEMDTGMRMQQLGASQTLRQIAGSGSEGAFTSALGKAQQFAPELYKDYQSKYLPGVGVAKVPVTPADRDALEGFNSLGKRLDQAIAFQDSVAGKGGVWTPSNRAMAQNLKNSIVVEMNKLTGLKRLNEYEFDNYTNQVGDIGSINTGGLSTKLRDIKQQLGQHKSAMMNSLGVQQFQKPNADQAAAAWAAANPKDPRAVAIQSRLRGGK